MLNKRAFYGDDWGVPSAEHPAGECLNRSAPGVEDGSYFEKAWVNDLMSLPGALMNAAGYTPNGTEDTATASQVFDALVNGRWSPIANYSVGTIITASDGNQYYCNKDNGRDTSPVDPVSDTLDSWRQYPYKTETGPLGRAVIWFNGDLECRAIVSNPSQSQRINFPAAFTSAPLITTGTESPISDDIVGRFVGKDVSGFSVSLAGSSSNFLFNYVALGNWD